MFRAKRVVYSEEKQNTLDLSKIMEITGGDIFYLRFREEKLRSD